MRLIDADALWMDIIHSMDYCDDFLSFVDAAPTVPQWIPVTERLPEEDGEYITTVEDGEGMFVTSNDWRRDWKEWGFLSYYNESEDPAWRRVTNVVAWMPLPEPHKNKEGQG